MLARFMTWWNKPKTAEPQDMRPLLARAAEATDLRTDTPLVTTSPDDAALHGLTFDQGNTAFGIIDVQVDFCNNGATAEETEDNKKLRGSLSVPGSDEIIEIINSARQFFQNCFLTQDFHPKKHVSFASTHKKKQYSLKDVYRYIFSGNQLAKKTQKQLMWPDHCVQDHPGAGFHARLITTGLPVKRKGEKRDADSYGMFDDNFGDPDTDLEKSLKKAGIKNLVLCGLALDVCVLTSCLQARARGMNVVLLLDATKPVEQDSEKQLAILRKLKARGVIIISSLHIAQTLKLEAKKDRDPRSNSIKSTVYAEQGFKSGPAAKGSDSEPGLEGDASLESKYEPETSSSSSTSLIQKNSQKQAPKAITSPPKEKESKPSVPEKSANHLLAYLESQIESMNERYPSAGLDSDKVHQFEAWKTVIKARLASAHTQESKEEGDIIDKDFITPPQPINLNEVDDWYTQVREAAKVHQATGLTAVYNCLFSRDTKSYTEFKKQFEENNHHFVKFKSKN